MKIAYDTTNYFDFLNELHKKIGGEFDGVTYRFPLEIAEGTMRILKIPGDLQIIISDYSTNSTLNFIRIKSKIELFILRIDYIEEVGDSHFETENSIIPLSNVIYSNILMTSSRFDFTATIAPGTKVKSAIVMLTKEWLVKYFPLFNVPYWMNYCHAIRLNGINRVPLDFESRKTLFDLISFPVNNPAYLIFSQTRVFDLMDYYGSHIFRQLSITNSKDILSVDVAKIIELDVLINENVMKQIALPNIDEMAVFTNMSASKLKTLFKKMYNQSIVEYFNACRLSSAREALKNGLMNIKEVSSFFGFNTVQYFTTAFKNQYGETPAAFIKGEDD